MLIESGAVQILQNARSAPSSHRRESDSFMDTAIQNLSCRRKKEKSAQVVGKEEGEQSKEDVDELQQELDSFEKNMDFTDITVPEQRRSKVSKNLLSRCLN